MAVHDVWYGFMYAAAAAAMALGERRQTPRKIYWHNLYVCAHENNIFLLRISFVVVVGAVEIANIHISYAGIQLAVVLVEQGSQPPIPMCTENKTTRMDIVQIVF